MIKYFGKAEPHGDFKLGSKDFGKYQKILIQMMKMKYMTLIQQEGVQALKYLLRKVNGK